MEMDNIQLISDKFEEIINNDNLFAKTIAAYIRNAMENFHSNNLTDEQMEELNPIIRNAIYTSLLDLKNNPARIVAYNILFVPKYWEDCTPLTL